MENYLKEALEIVKAQASVRTMNEEEIITMVRTVAEGIRTMSEFSTDTSESEAAPSDAKKAIKEKSITCMECGKSFKIITKKHLASHGLNPDEYRERYNYKKGVPLVCKALQRERRKKMKSMKLWERRSTPA